MAKERSSTSCFQSKYGGGWISASQYLAEIMCAKEAASQKENLPDKFWNDDYWNKKFRKQISHATDLLKEYSVEDVLEALRHPDLKRVYSLGLKSAIVPILKRIKARKSRQAQQENSIIKDKDENPVTVTVNILEGPRKPFSTKTSSLKKLRDLE